MMLQQNKVKHIFLKMHTSQKSIKHFNNNYTVLDIGRLYTIYNDVNDGHDKLLQIISDYMDKYYAQKANEWLDTLPITLYLLNAEKSIQKETELFQYIDHKPSGRCLLNVIQNQLLINPLDKLLLKESGAHGIYHIYDNIDDNDAKSGI